MLPDGHMVIAGYELIIGIAAKKLKAISKIIGRLTKPPEVSGVRFQVSANR